MASHLYHAMCACMRVLPVKAQARPWIPSRPVESVTSSCPDLVGFEDPDEMPRLERHNEPVQPPYCRGIFPWRRRSGNGSALVQLVRPASQSPDKRHSLSGKRPPTRAGPVLSLTLGRAQAQSPCSANHAARICKADGGSEVGVPRTLGWHGIFLLPTTLTTTGSTDVAQMARACSD